MLDPSTAQTSTYNPAMTWVLEVDGDIDYNDKLKMVFKTEIYTIYKVIWFLGIGWYGDFRVVDMQKSHEFTLASPPAADAEVTE